MYYRIGIIAHALIFSVFSISASTPHNEITTHGMITQECVSLFILSQLIGTKYATALYRDKKRIDAVTYELFKRLYACPTEIQQKVLQYLDFRNIPMLQNAYVQGFEHTIWSKKFEDKCQPKICMLTNDTFVVNACHEPIAIGSLKTNNFIFESSRTSGGGLCVIPPSLIFTGDISYDHLNIARIQKDGFEDIDTVPIINQFSPSLLFPLGQHVVACTAAGHIDVYDLETKQRIYNAKQVYSAEISAGTSIDNHCFATGGNAAICAWDIRTEADEEKSVVELYEESNPKSVKLFDDRTLLVGCNRQPSLISIDLRKPKTYRTEGYSAQQIHDIGLLRDKTIVLCAQNIEFGYRKNQLFKCMRTIETYSSIHSISVSENDTIGLVNFNNIISILKPSTTPLCSQDPISFGAAFMSIALADDDNPVTE